MEAVDNFIDRMWDVYYPALALARVPSQVPHTDGAIMSTALQHVLTPRILVPGSPAYGPTQRAGSERAPSVARWPDLERVLLMVCDSFGSRQIRVRKRPASQ